MDGGDEIPSVTQSQTLHFMVGMLLTCSMYAIYACLFAVTAHLVIHESARTSMWFYLTYIVVAFLVYTINVSSVLSTDASLLLCTIKDGMPFLLCKITMVLTPLSVRRLNLNGTSAVVISALADSLSIWRAWVLWQRKYIVIIPSLLMLALSIGLYGWGAALPDLAPANLIFAQDGLSAAVDLVTTSIIITRLLLHRRSVSMLGSQHQQQYTTLVAIFVESSAIVSITRILNAILQFTRDGETSWSQALANGASAIGPLLVVLRVTLKIAHDGRSPRVAYGGYGSGNGSTQPSTMQFSPNPRAGTNGSSSAVKTVIASVVDKTPHNLKFTHSQASTTTVPGSAMDFSDKHNEADNDKSIRMVDFNNAV